MPNTLNVLIVDDSTIFRTILVELLEERGYNIAGQAADGQEGVDKFEQLRPDVTFLDVTMPTMNGLQALKQIKSIDSEAKIVMISSTACQENIAEALIDGAYEFLRKPLDPEQIYKVMSDFEAITN